MRVTLSKRTNFVVMVLLLYQESMRLELLEVHQSAEEAVARNNESVRADLQRIQEVSNLELVCTKSTLARANAGGGYTYTYIYIRDFPRRF